MTQEQTPCTCVKFADLCADLAFANARISDYQNTVESLTNANKVKTARCDELERKVATLEKMLGQSDRAMRVTMYQNSAMRSV